MRNKVSWLPYMIVYNLCFSYRDNIFNNRETFDLEYNDP